MSCQGVLFMNLEGLSIVSIYDFADMEFLIKKYSTFLIFFHSRTLRKAATIEADSSTSTDGLLRCELFPRNTKCRLTVVV
jgi:hypothetical protein